MREQDIDIRRPFSALERRHVVILLLVVKCSAIGALPDQKDQAGVMERSLAVVLNPYAEEGVTMRHLGRIGSVKALGRSQIQQALQAGPRTLMNFSAALGDRDEDLVYVYSVMLEGAIVGYEGLVFDPTRLFNLEDAWHDIFHRPEALTLNQSPDKPRLDPADKSRVLVSWRSDWPEHQGLSGWNCSSCSTSGAGLQGTGSTWEYWHRIVNILQRSAHAYYHFVAECLPKVLLVLTEIAQHPDAVLLVDESYGGGAWTQEFFGLLGIPAHRLVVRAPGKVYLADFVHMMKPTPVHRGHSELIRIMSAKILHGVGVGAAVRGDVIPGADRHSGNEVADRIVLVQRTPRNNQHSKQHDACKLSGGCKVREVINMHELKTALAQAFPQLHVQVFDSDGMSIRDQVLLFSRAVAVIGAHGAGLTNAIFAPRGGAVLELMPEILQRASVNMIFWHLAVSVGHEHATYIAPHNLMSGDNATALHNFRVPVPDLVASLRRMLLASPLLATRRHLLQ